MSNFIKNLKNFMSAHIRANAVSSFTMLWKRPLLRRGLTLVELAIVLLVLGILMTILYAGISSFTGISDAKKMGVKQSAAILPSTVEKYESDVGPLDDRAELSIMTHTTANWKGISEDMINDPWKHPYFMCVDEQQQKQICSNGKDGVPGGEGENADFMLTNKSTWPQWLSGAKPGAGGP